MTVDYVVVGQGICGTFLSYNLLQQGKTVLVIDQSDSFSATKVASGVINPVTGRRIVRTWMIEEVLPFAEAAYRQLENEFGTALIQTCNLPDFHSTHQNKGDLEKKEPKGVFNF